MILQLLFLDGREYVFHSSLHAQYPKTYLVQPDYAVSMGWMSKELKKVQLKISGMN